MVSPGDAWDTAGQTQDMQGDDIPRVLLKVGPGAVGTLVVEVALPHLLPLGVDILVVVRVFRNPCLVVRGA